MFLYKKVAYSFFISLAFLISFSEVNAQDKNEETLANQANELFKAGNYVQAKDVYSQLVSLYPKNENYNYRFGACLLFTDKDKEFPLKFLEYSVTQPNVDIEAFYYMGKGLHYNLRFQEAIPFYEKYISKVPTNAKEVLPAKDEVRYCYNGMQLLQEIKEPSYLSEIKVSRQDFLMSIKIKEMGGRILRAPSELQSKEDKKRGYSPVMYVNSNTKQIYFSSYGKTGDMGLDIYVAQVKPNGDLDDPIRLSDQINTPYDDSYPFMNEDETEFYFASKGHNSMGGYDIFFSAFNKATQTYSKAVNMDYSINTPDNDYMFATVKSEGVSYFASDRNCEPDKTYVYRIDLQINTVKVTVLKGTFESPSTKSCKITVTDLDRNEEVGTYSSSKTTGEYRMRLHIGGNYSFLVEPYGDQVAYKGTVKIPVGSDAQLNQEIRIISENGNDRLVIRNLFGDQIVVEKKEEKDPEPEKTPFVVKPEVSNKIKESQSNLTEYIRKTKNDANRSYALAKSKTELAKKDLAMAEQLESQISVNDDSPENQAKRKELEQLLQDAQTHSDEANSAIGLAKTLDSLVVNAENQKRELTQLGEAIASAEKSGNGDQLNAAYEQYKKKSEDLNPKDVDEVLAEQLEQKEKSTSSLIKKAENVEVRQLSLREEIKKTRIRKNSTTDPDEKDQYDVEIADLEEELAPLEAQKEDLYRQAELQSRRASSVRFQTSSLAQMETEEQSSYPVQEVSIEEKGSLVASVTLTSSEIAALKKNTYEKLKVDTPRNQQVAVNETNLGTSGTTTIANNEEGRPEITNTSTNPEAQATEAVAEEALAVGTEEEANEAVEAAENPTSETITEESVAVSSENQEGKENIERSNNQPTNISTQTAEAIAEEAVAINDETSPESNPKEYFAYSEEYEQPSEEVIEIDGAVIPLEITSNTGKLPMTYEEIQKETPLLSIAAYQSEFEEEQEGLKLISNPLERSKESQRINYQWLVQIEKEKAVLTYAKENTTNPEYLGLLNEKIQMLDDQASQKRNYLALNSRIVKQLEAQPMPDLDLSQNTTGSQTVNNSNSSIASSDKPVREEDNSPAESNEEVEENTTTLPVVIPEATRAESERRNNTEAETAAEVNPVVNTPRENTEVVEATATGKPETERTVSVNQNMNSTGTPQTESNSPSNASKKDNPIPPGFVLDQPDMVEETLASVATKEANQEEIVNNVKTEFAQLESEYAGIKKKKLREAKENEMESKRDELRYEEQKLSLIQNQEELITESTKKLIANPLAARPSEVKYENAKQLEIKYRQAESRVRDLNETLSKTRKKKEKRVIEAQVIDAEAEMRSLKMQYDLALETARMLDDMEVETLKTKTKYGSAVIVDLPQVPNELSAEEVEDVKSSSVYVEYQNEVDQFNRKMEEADVLYAKAQDKREEVADYEIEIMKLTRQLVNTPASEQQPLLQQIEEIETKKSKIIREASVMYQEAQELTQDAYYDMNEATLALVNSPDRNQRNQILAVISGNVGQPSILAETSEPVNPEPISRENINTIPRVLSSPIFETSNETYYSDSNPIPENVELPSGLVYKVQVGAFRNPIKPGVFKGFAPIVAESAGNGLKRYTAGLFTDFASADQAKVAIRNLGYNDAFVVAYRDGKRVSVTQARQVQSGEISESQLGTPTMLPMPETDVRVNVSKVEPQTVAQGSRIQVSNVNSRGQLYFTVQVGVYNSSVNPSSVLKISPLNADPIPGNLVRYSAGVYGSVGEAIVARNRIVQNGISDAFVTAYYNGQRVNVAEAKERALNTSSTGTTRNNNNTGNVSNISIVEQGTTDEGSEVFEGEIPSRDFEVNTEFNSNVPKAATAGQTYYFVRIGPYTSDIPSSEARVILSLSTLGVVVEKNNGETYYKIGNFTDESEAKSLQEELITKGLTNPELSKSE